MLVDLIASLRMTTHGEARLIHTVAAPRVRRAFRDKRENQFKTRMDLGLS